MGSTNERHVHCVRALCAMLTVDNSPTNNPTEIKWTDDARHEEKQLIMQQFHP